MAYTKQDIDKMNSDVYRDKMQNEPGFVEAVNAIEFGVKDARDRVSTQHAGYQPAGPVSTVQYDQEGREIVPAVVEAPTTEVEPAMVEVAVVTQPVLDAPVSKKFEIRYQPIDDSGNAIGGEQVVKYEAETEISATHPLIQQLIKNHMESIKGMRKLVKNARLGITEEVKESIPETAPRYSAEDEVTRFTEADFPGLVPEIARKKADALNRNQDETIQNRALLEANAFTAAEPRYVRSNDNMGTLLNWMVKNNLKPVRANFQLAFDTLVAEGILLLPPTKREEATVPVVAPIANSGELSAAPPVASRITEPAVAPEKRPVAGVGTGLTDNNSSHVEPITRDPLVDGFILEVVVRDEKGKATGQVKVYKGLEALDRMPSEEYKRRYNANPSQFSRQVEAVEATRRRSKQAR